jgi:hypothetical protein
MMEQFFDEHRDLRLYKIRLQDRDRNTLTPTNLTLLT